MGGNCLGGLCPGVVYWGVYVLIPGFNYLKKSVCKL